jgi:hypothetical protein
LGASRKSIAYSFVLDELESLVSPERVRVKPMFGSHALYVDEKIVFMVRRKEDPKTARDNGIWVAMIPEHSPSIAKQFPVLRGIELFEDRGRQAFTGWMNLPEGEDGFEETALEICRLIAKGDPRLGKVPKQRSKARRSKTRRD